MTIRNAKSNTINTMPIALPQMAAREGAFRAMTLGAMLLSAAFVLMSSVNTAHAQRQRHLPGNTAMGATAGFLVGGPIGAAAGGAIGFFAGEDIAHGMGVKKPYRRYWVDRNGRRHYYR